MNIKLRNKTEAHLSKLFETRKAAVLKYMKIFMEFSEDKAFRELVKIKVSPEEILEKNKFLDGITTDTLQKIYGDLSANYKALHSYCWLNDELETYPEYLCKELNNDRTLLRLIKETVNQRFESDISMDSNKLHFLLQSEDEKYRFGGLRELWFAYAEANLFKNYAKVIDKYICETFLSKDEIHATNSIPAKEATDENFEEIENPTLRESISAADVINNADKINHFLLICNEIKKLGLEPETLLKNSDKISALLIAAANL